MKVTDAPDDPAVAQAVALIRSAIGNRSLRMAAALAGVAPNTLKRALRGQNISLETLNRIVVAFGRTLVLRAEPTDSAQYVAHARRVPPSSYL